MEILRADYTVVTPMFLGGADQTPADGIRPPSIKGALRFWWRALNWGRFWQANKKDENKALKALHQEEARLFGAAMDAEKKTGGQGCFLLSIKQTNDRETCDNWPPNNPNHGASYMAYGLLKTNDEPHRIALTEGLTFTLQLAFKPKTTETDYEQIKQALEAWSLLGGMGGRARRAMGSVTLMATNNTPQLLTKTAYDQKLKTLFARFNTIPPAPFTALSKESHYRIINTSKNARTLLERVGKTYKEFRSQAGLRGNKKVPFGLPLENVDLENRRGSPLFFHMHQLANKTIASTIIYLPASIFHYESRYSHVSLHKVKEFASGGIK